MNDFSPKEVYRIAICTNGRVELFSQENIPRGHPEVLDALERHGSASVSKYEYGRKIVYIRKSHQCPYLNDGICERTGKEPISSLYCHDATKLPPWTELMIKIEECKSYNEDISVR